MSTTPATGSQPWFRKYNQDESLTSTSQCKSSLQRSIRSKLIQDYPAVEEIIDDLIPKKTQLVLGKCQGHINLLLAPDGEVLFFQHREGTWFPTLRLVHRFPQLGATWQVDKGAIKHVLAGANVFCGGLVSSGAKMEADLQPGQPVILMAEGKVHACAVGVVVMSADDVRANPKGVAVDIVHFLNDGLWMNPKVV